MKREKAIKFATENPLCYMATIDNDRPHIRIMKLWFADHSGFYFEALSPKDLSMQIHKNPKVEICFFNNPARIENGREMRISGNMEIVTDAALLNKAKHDKEYLEDLGGQATEPYIEVFKLAHGDVNFWDIRSNIMQENIENHMIF